MKFDDVQKIFYKYIPRRYHRFSRELFAQIFSLYSNLKSAYLFDLFPYTIEEMRHLLDHLSDSGLPVKLLLLKYSINDLILVNSTQLSQLKTRSILLIDLATMQTRESHPMLAQIREHIAWIDRQRKDRVDFDDETNEDWAKQIEQLNHTTVFGYLLGYPLVYFYSSLNDLDVHTLKNFRLYIQITDFREEVLLYSFSCPLHASIDPEQIESTVNQWFSSISTLMDSTHPITGYHLERSVREQHTWCF